MSKAVDPRTSLPKGVSFDRPAIIGGDVVYPREVIPPPADMKTVRLEDLPFYAKQCAKPLPPKDKYELRVWVEFDLEYKIDDQINKAKKSLMTMSREAAAFMDTLRSPDGKYDPDDYAPLEVRTRKPRAEKRTDQKGIDGDYELSLLRIFDAVNCGRTYQEIETDWIKLTDSYLDKNLIGRRYHMASKLWRRL